MPRVRVDLVPAYKWIDSMKMLKLGKIYPWIGYQLTFPLNSMSQLVPKWLVTSWILQRGYHLTFRVRVDLSASLSGYGLAWYQRDYFCFFFLWRDNKGLSILGCYFRELKICVIWMVCINVQSNDSFCTKGLKFSFFLPLSILSF